MQSRRHSALKSVIIAIFAIAFAASAFVRPANAQTYSVVTDFSTDLYPTDGGAAVQGRDGNIYGSTLEGGTSGIGTVFQVTPSGTLTTLYSFDGTVGSYPYGGFALGTDGNFYGTASQGGSAGFGSVYKITPAGVITSLHAFTNTGDGKYPGAALALGNDGNFYGGNASTIYKVTAAGVFTALHTLNSATDGSGVQYLILGQDGNFYGTTASGGTNNYGTLFKVTPSGSFTVLHAFANGTDGFQPGSIAQAANGTLYGDTYVGGSGGGGVLYKSTTSGTFTVLYSLNSSTDGYEIAGSLTLGTDGNFYNVASADGANSGGTLFKISPAGVFTKVLDFNGADVGSDPESGLLQATSGIFYGGTGTGGSGNASVFYSVSEGLSPFAALVSTSGKEGARIGILGQGFTTATTVKFGGVAATTVARTGSTFLTATVPAGALTGSVTVTTGSTTLTSSQAFKVKPTVTGFAPPSGPVGTVVTLTGTGLTQATKVTFNATSATFTVNSDTQITATVPTGATTGKIGVTTKGGTASSTGTFTVN